MGMLTHYRKTNQIEKEIKLKEAYRQFSLKESVAYGEAACVLCELPCKGAEFVEPDYLLELRRIVRTWFNSSSNPNENQWPGAHPFAYVNMALMKQIPVPSELLDEIEHIFLMHVGADNSKALKYLCLSAKIQDREMKRRADQFNDEVKND